MGLHTLLVWQGNWEVGKSTSLDYLTGIKKLSYCSKGGHHLFKEKIPLLYFVLHLKFDSFAPSKNCLYVSSRFSVFCTCDYVCNARNMENPMTHSDQAGQTKESGILGDLLHAKISLLLFSHYTRVSVSVKC
jgi:hypothetical protein